ncbi:hypothetical protein IWZ01DRAFT_1882 [Phyllosticta capitalensis]
MASRQNHNLEEGIYVSLSNRRSPSPISRPSSEYKQNAEISTTTLSPLRSSSSVRKLPRGAPEHAIEISDTIPSKTPAIKSRRQRWSQKVPRDVWAKEMSSIALSIGCMIAVFAILISQNDKPLSSWPFPWQPNSVVSFLSTISRAALIYPMASCISQFKWLHFRQKSQQLQDLQHFDAASRGPLGSLSFVLRVSFRSRSIVATLACLLTIAALSMETFVQQTIDYSTRPVRTYVKPCFAKTTQSYSGGNSFDDVTAQNSNMAKAIHAGIFGASSFQTLTCPTGNCTWTGLTTLGVCSSCQNVTTTIRKNCTTEEYPSGRDTTGSEVWCRYWSDLGNEVEAIYWIVDIDRASSGQILTALNITSTTSGISSMIPGDPLGLAKVTIIRNPIPGQGSSPTEAFDCSLSWCGKVFDTTVESGDTRLSNKKTFNVTQELTFTDHYTLSGPSEYMGQTNYTVRGTDHTLMQSTLKEMFDAASLTKTSTIQVMSLDFTSYLYTSDSIPEVIDDMAMAMTDFVRTVNSDEIGGETFENVTFLHVNWPWFIAPVVIEISAAIVLAAAVVISNRERNLAGTQIWKSSIFPFLFNGIDRDRLDEIGPGTTDRASEMERRAQQISVRLDRDEADGRLRFA